MFLLTSRKLREMWVCWMTPVLEITAECSVGSCSKNSHQQLPANLVLPTQHVWKSGLHPAATWVTAEEITSHPLLPRVFYCVGRWAGCGKCDFSFIAHAAKQAPLDPWPLASSVPSSAPASAEQHHIVPALDRRTPLPNAFVFPSPT